MPTLRTSPAPCDTKARLTMRLQKVHARITELDQREVELVLGTDFEYGAWTALEQRLTGARARRAQAMNAIRRHIAEHGC